MSRPILPTPKSRLRFGLSRCDITPPVGCYHRFWGAALQDKSTGVHRPLTATALAFLPVSDIEESAPRLLIAIDHCLLRPREMDEVLLQTARAADVEAGQIIFAFSHTHSGSHLNRDRASLPGGEFIGPYLDQLPSDLGRICRDAIQSAIPAEITYGKSICDMGRHRDYWDEELGRYVCGFNPDGEIDQQVLVARITSLEGKAMGTVVNYGCHPTTLAWENSLISPDYVGALREAVERETNAPCAFLLSACGDVGPLRGFSGDTDLADQNGRQLGFAALSALTGLPAVATDLAYTGAVISGATLGTWTDQPQSPDREAAVASFSCREFTVPLPYHPSLPKLADAEERFAELLAMEEAALKAGEEAAARETRALTERQRRLLDRLRPLPQTDRYPFSVAMWRMGDAVWIAVEGEPYNVLQARLRERFPELVLFITTVANGARSSYLPPKDAFDQPLYQAEIAILAPGCLETLIDEITRELESW